MKKPSLKTLLQKALLPINYRLQSNSVNIGKKLKVNLTSCLQSWINHSLFGWELSEKIRILRMLEEGEAKQKDYQEKMVSGKWREEIISRRKGWFSPITSLREGRYR